MHRWNPQACSGLMGDVRSLVTGYVGADLRGVCSEAAVQASCRSNPHLWGADGSAAPRAVAAAEATAADCFTAMSEVVPCALRPVQQVARRLLTRLLPLLGRGLQACAQAVQTVLPEELFPPVDGGTSDVARLRGEALGKRPRWMLVRGTAAPHQADVAKAIAGPHTGL